MKKKFIYAVTFVALAAVAGWNYQQSKQESEYNLTLANIEALASGESGSQTCYNTITTKAGSKVLYCQTCS